MIGSVAFGTDAEFLDGLQCERVHLALGLGARAEYLKEVAASGA